MSNTENKIPTAEELILKKVNNEEYGTYNGGMNWTDLSLLPDIIVSDLMIEFATLHLQAQKKDILIQIYNDNGAYTAKESLDRAYNIEENVK